MRNRLENLEQTFNNFEVETERSRADFIESQPLPFITSQTLPFVTSQPLPFMTSQRLPFEPSAFRLNSMTSQPFVAPFMTSPLRLNSEGEEKHFSDSDDEISDGYFYYSDDVFSD